MAKQTIGDAVSPWPEFNMEDAKGALAIARGDFSAHNVRHAYNLVGFGLSFPFPLGSEPRPPVGAATATPTELTKEQVEQHLEKSIALKAGPQGVAADESQAFPWISIALFIGKLLLDYFKK